MRKLKATQGLIETLAPAARQKQQASLTQRGILLERSQQNPLLSTQNRKATGTREAYIDLTIPERVILAAFLSKG